MFNHDAYNARLAEIKKEITTGDDQTWLMDVSLRYGRFLAERARDQLQTVIDIFPGIDIVPDKQKHRNYCAEQIMGVVAGMYSSSALIRGAIKIADPLGAEAMMRIFAEAGFKKEDPVIAKASAAYDRQYPENKAEYQGRMPDGQHAASDPVARPASAPDDQATGFAEATIGPSGEAGRG